MYPNYVYRPQRTKPAKGKKGKGRRGDDSEQDTDGSFSCTLPVNLASSSSRQQHGRARSAPTPPLTYQTIHIPTVYMPSRPPSPSLYPRRTSLPRLSLDQDLPRRSSYQSDDSLMPPPSFHHPRDFEGNFQVCLLAIPASIATDDFFPEQRNVPRNVRLAGSIDTLAQEHFIVVNLDTPERINDLTNAYHFPYFLLLLCFSIYASAQSIHPSRRFPPLTACCRRWKRDVDGLSTP